MSANVIYSGKMGEQGVSVDPTEYTEEELADMTPEELSSSQPKRKRKTNISDLR